MNAVTDLALPTIHLNGTSRDSLVSELCAASYAIYKASEALAKCTPNGRDYYPQSPDAIRVATDQHNTRVAKLRQVREELCAIAEAII